MKKEFHQLSCEIFALALLVNEETEYCVFVDYSGHVDTMGIRFAESKDNYNKGVFETDIRTGYKKRYKENKNDELAYLKSQRDILRQVLDRGEIPYESLTEHVEQNITYSF